MTKVRNFLLCLVLLALAGILHHEWTQMTGSSGIEPEVRAATLANAVGSACNGAGKWHFINNQTTGLCGDLTATFSCNGVETKITVPVTPGKCLSSTAHYNVTTNGNCTLVTASTGDQPGRLVLSDFSCGSATPTPTPTPSPSPSPSPTA
jgi:hypothetical protein